MTMKNRIKVFSHITGGCYQQEYWILKLQHRERKRSGAKGGELAYRRFSFLYFKIQTMKSGRQETINGVEECKMCFCNTKTLVPIRQGLLPPGKTLINPLD